MKCAPFAHVRQSALRKIAACLPGLDFNRDLELAVYGMEMGRAMISIVHRDHDAEEPAELGHPFEAIDWWKRAQ